jgi:hypothetical protein
LFNFVNTHTDTTTKLHLFLYIYIEQQSHLFPLRKLKKTENIHFAKQLYQLNLYVLGKITPFRQAVIRPDLSFSANSFSFSFSYSWFLQCSLFPPWFTSKPFQITSSSIFSHHSLILSYPALRLRRVISNWGREKKLTKFLWHSVSYRVLFTLNYMPHRMKVKPPCLAILSVTVFFSFLFRLRTTEIVCLFLILFFFLVLASTKCLARPFSDNVWVVCLQLDIEK